MKSMVCSGVQAPAGFSLRPRAVRPVNTKPGISRCALSARARRVAQFVLQRLGKGFHARFRNIVGGIAGRRGDALLRAGIDDEARPPARDHAGREDLRAVNHAPEIDAENALPVFGRAEHLASGLNARIVHQHVRAAEPFAHRGFQPRDLIEVADIGDRGHHARRALRCRCAQFCRSLRKLVRSDIGDTNPQAETREPHRRREANSGRPSGDDGDVIRSEGGMRHFDFLPGRQTPAKPISLIS